MTLSTPPAPSNTVMPNDEPHPSTSHQYDHKSTSSSKTHTLSITQNKSQKYLNVKISSSFNPASSTLYFILTTTVSLAILYHYHYHSVSHKTPLVMLALWLVMVMLTLKSCIRVEESVMVIDIGMQLSSSLVLYRYTIWKDSRFYSSNTIRNVVINEYFKKFEVIYYLCLILDVNNEKQIIVMFPRLLPRLDMLQKIYTKIHN